MAIVAKLLSVIKERILLGYDIGCSFQTTVDNSSLGSQFKESGSRCCVNTFHGYSHNYACQLKNHPNSIEGIGLEDLETLERIFSASNQLASIIRYATAFRRRVLIDLFFQQWDKDKYQNLANMLYGNYVQALKIINDDTVALEEAKKSLDINDDDLERWHKEETEYFKTIGTEPEYDVLSVAYVESLQELREIECIFIVSKFYLSNLLTKIKIFTDLSTFSESNRRRLPDTSIGSSTRQVI